MRKIFKERIEKIFADTEPKPTFEILPKKKSSFTNSNSPSPSMLLFTQRVRGSITSPNRFPVNFPQSKKDKPKNPIFEDIDNFRDFQSAKKSPSSRQQLKDSPFKTRYIETLNELQTPRSNNNVNKPIIGEIKGIKRDEFLSCGCYANRPTSSAGISDLFVKIESIARRTPNGATYTNNHQYSNKMIGSPKKKILNQLSPKEQLKCDEEMELREYGRFNNAKNKTKKDMSNSLINNSLLSLRLNTVS